MVQQAKDSIKAVTTNLIRPNSEDICSIENDGATSSRKYDTSSIDTYIKKLREPKILKLNTVRSKSCCEDRNYSADSGYYAARYNDKYVSRVERNTDVYDYFRELYKDEERKRCLHLQPNNIKPYGSSDGLYFPDILRPRSESKNFKSPYLLRSRNDTQKRKFSSRNSGKDSLDSHLPSYISANKMSRNDLLKEEKCKYNSQPMDPMEDIHCSEISFAAQAKSSRHCQRGNSGSDLSLPDSLRLNPKRMSSLGSISLSKKDLSGSLRNYSDMSDVDIKLVPTRPLFSNNSGSRFNISPLVGPQYLKGNNVNHRSVCGIMKSNDSCTKVSIKKKTKEARVLPKLPLKKCPNIGMPEMKKVPLQRLKKRYSPQDPVKCNKIISREECHRADDNWRITSKPFSKISDSPKPESAFEMKTGAPMQRLPKIKVSDPARHCEALYDPCPIRSDAGMQIKKKVLPSIPSGQFSTFLPKAITPQSIKRLARVVLSDPPKISPKPMMETIHRLDGEIRVHRKRLPEIVSSCRPPTLSNQLKSSPELMRMKRCVVKEVPRVCRISTDRCNITFKSDEGDWIYDTGRDWEKKSIKSRTKTQLNRKTLPKFEKSQCKIAIYPYTLKEGEPLRRPKKFNHPVEPIKECVQPLQTPVQRTDRELKVFSKSLPKMPISRHSPSFPRLKDGVSVKRLGKPSAIEPLRSCPQKSTVCDANVRSDHNLTVCKHVLPKLQSSSPPPSRKHIPTIKPLHRLPKLMIEEPLKTCEKKPIEKCERMEDQIRTPRKILPSLITSGYPPRTSPMKDAPPLKRPNSRKITYVQRCGETPIIPEHCERSDIDDWDYIGDRSCQPIRDPCSKQSTGNINAKRSMSTNLSNYYNKGLLVRMTQLSHVDMRKRFSNETRSKGGNENFIFHKGKAQIHMSTSRNCDKDASLKKELQPKYPVYSKFRGVQPIKPEAPKLDPELEDHCIRTKCNLPQDDMTASCDNPQVKQKFLRVTKGLSAPCPEKTSSSTSGSLICASNTSSLSPSPCPPAFSPPPAPTGSTKCVPPSSPQCPQPFSPNPSPPPCSAPCPPPCPPPYPPPCPPPCPPSAREPCPKFQCPCDQKASLWQRIKNYFKARPNCPPPGAYKKKKLTKKVFKLAKKAGLAVYDPCDDPKCILKEVERRCCLARKNPSACKEGRRYFCSLETMRHFSSMSGTGMSSNYGGWFHIFRQNIAVGSFVPKFTWFLERAFSSWKDPLEFYSLEYENNGNERCRDNLENTENSNISRDRSIYLYKSYGGIDLDGVVENMFRTLWPTTFYNTKSTEEESSIDVRELLECSSDDLELRRQILVEVLSRISQNLEAISKKNKVNMEEVDSTQRTLEVLGKILNTRNRR